MLQMIWEWVPDDSSLGGAAYARRPRDPEGNPRVPDGVRWLSIEQAAERLGKSREFMLRDYRSSMADLLWPDEAEILQSDDSTPPPDIHLTTSDEVPREHLSSAGEAKRVSAHNLARLDLLRGMQYSNFDDEQWEFFLAQCQVRRLNPFCNQMIGILQPDPDKPAKRKVAIIVSIDGMRLIAHRTGLFAGVDQPKWEMSDGLPLSATVTIHKLIDGQPRAFTATAHYDEYAHTSLTDYRERMPRNWLAKCAKALALRDAFPQELGGLHTPEEMARLTGGTEPTVTVPIARGSEGVSEPWRDDVPAYPSHGLSLPKKLGADKGMTWPEFQGRVIAHGYSSADGSLQKLIQRMRRRFQTICDASPGLFYAQIVRELEEGRGAA